MKIKEKKKITKLKDNLYKESVLQRKQAWCEKDYKKSLEIRDEQKINYEKWKLLNGLLKEMEKENED